MNILKKMITAYLKKYGLTLVRIKTIESIHFDLQNYTYDPMGNYLTAHDVDLIKHHQRALSEIIGIKENKK